MSEKQAVCVIGCGAEKMADPCEAVDMYVGSLFKAASRYARQHHPGNWLIISAKYGILLPTDIIEPYEKCLARDEDVRQLSSLIKHRDQFEKLGYTPETHRIEAHCGKLYLYALRGVYLDRLPGQAVRRFEVSSPVEGLQVGQRLAWYKARRIEPAAPAGELPFAG